MTDLFLRADKLNLKYPPGTSCRFWSGRREGGGTLGTIIQWGVLSGHTLGAWISPGVGFVAESHIDCTPELLHHGRERVVSGPLGVELLEGAGI